MDDRQFMHYIRQVLPAAGLGRLSVPIGTFSNPSEVTFQGFGVTNPDDTFSKGWRFSMSAASSARFMRAFQTGSVTFRARNPANGTTNAVILVGMDAVGTLLRSELTPSWFPLPKFITYEGVDEAATRAVLHDFLTAERKTFQGLLRYLGTSLTIDEYLNEFFAGTVSAGIPVAAGQNIAVAQQNDSGARSVSIFMQSDKGLDEDLYLDPAVYHAHWDSFFTNLAGHPLEQSLKTIRFGIISNGVVRYVRANGVDTGPFTASNTPARLLSLAVDEANAYDTIVFLDASTYQEDDEIVITQPLSISSLSTDDSITTTNPAFPVLDGKNEHRLIRVGGPFSLVDADDEEEVVSISNLVIANGFRDAQAISSEPGFDFRATYGGAGISVHRYNRVYIRNCYVHHNRATSRNLMADWSESHEERILENGFGAGILVFYCSPFIYHNRITNNDTERRGGGIGVWGYSWPHVVDNLIAQNSASGTGGGEGDGGGVAVETAVPSRLTMIAGGVDVRPDWAWSNEDIARARTNKIRFVRNQFLENTASDDGGGLYVTVLTRASLEQNLFQSNTARSGGGGMRASFGSEVFLRGDVFRDNQTNPAEDSPKNGGGAIAARSTSMHLVDVTIESNTAHGFAGGGIVFTSTQEGSPFMAPVPGSTTFDDILEDVFQPQQFTLALEGNTRIFENSSTMFDTTDRRKGGGLYVLRFQGTVQNGFFTGLPLRVIIEDATLISNNHLPGPGPLASGESIEIHIDDQVYRVNDPVTDANKGEFMAGNSLSYESIP